MIEIVLDGNADDKFCGQKYAIVEIDSVTLNNWSEYREAAQQIIRKHAKEQTIIIKLKNTLYLNKLSLALFFESIKNSNQLQYAVFKVDDLPKVRELYKPYVALTIAIKYALNLVNEEPKTIYKNISGLGYLGIDTQQDFTNNILTLTLPNSGSKPVVMDAKNLRDTVCGVAILKALSLAQIKINIQLNVECSETENLLDKDTVVEQIINNISAWIN